MENEQINETNQSTETVKTKNSSNSMLIAGIALAVLVLVVGFALAGRNSNNNSILSQENTQGNVTTEPSQDTAIITSQPEALEESVDQPGDTMEEGETKIVDIEGGAFYFDPNEITAKKGETIKIVFTNAGGTHDFVIDELDVKTPIIQTGDSAEVEFTATESGVYEFYCSVGNHRQMGMVGTLTVTD